MKSLKILHVANRADKKCGKQFYSLPYKINNGLIRNGHNVIWFSDRDVSRALAPFKTQKLGKSACNKSLIEFCRNFRPDILLFGHADIISAETIAIIRSEQKQMRVAQYNIDGLLAPNNLKKIHSKSDVVDITFCTTAGPILERVVKGGSAAAFIPNPIDPSIEIHKNFMNDDLGIDVFFAGQISNIAGPADMRHRVTELNHHFPTKKIVVHHSIWGSDYIDELQQVRIGLGFSTPPPVSENIDISSYYMYSSDRISQYLGNGLITITNRAFAMEDLYGEGSLYSVADFEELVEKIDYCLGHPAESRKVAESGWQTGHTHFNERIVARFMVETVMEYEHSENYRWPTKLWN